jgi:glycolate oxidase iron-sulfur subunit
MEDIAKQISPKVQDVTDYLAEVISPQELGGVEACITYHDPCHLVRGLGVSQQPRHLVRSIPGVEFKEMLEADRCCGAGGMFQVFHSDLAWAITQRKVKNIENTHADMVVTACPACIQRLQGGINLRGISQKVVHVVELLDMAYAAADAQAEVLAGIAHDS